MLIEIREKSRRVDNDYKETPGALNLLPTDPVVVKLIQTLQVLAVRRTNALND
eukprot:gene3579-4083_t